MTTAPRNHDESNARSDSLRIFLTCVLVYIAFWNPWLQSSMTWGYLDAAVSFVNTGRWEMAHASFYNGMDTAIVEGRMVSSSPPGMSAVMVPLYVVWRSVAGPVDSREEFQTFNAFLSLVLGATSAGLVVTQVAWMAAWIGANRHAQLLTAALVAFGTQNFFFGTVCFKEGPAALAVLAAVRCAVEPGEAWRRILAGFLTGVTTVLVHTTALLAVLLLPLIAWREGKRRAMLFVLGGVPMAVALAAYNTWLFGKPWLTGYDFSIWVSGMTFVVPKLTLLLDLLVGTHGGLFLYAPFLVYAVSGVVNAWRTERRGEGVVAACFLAALVFATASWQSQFGNRAGTASSLGHRMLFPGIPLFAAFAAPVLERVNRRALLLVAGTSIFFGYLSAQAGLITEFNPFPYAVKTWLSGTGMGVLFKEALPAWFGVETLHTMVSRPEVGAGDIITLLQTPVGLSLVWHQLAFLAANLLVLTGMGWCISRFWRGRMIEEN